VQAILAGDFIPLTGYEGTLIEGRGQLVVGATPTGDRVDIAITGLTPQLQYTAHIHALPCAYGGGGHYKLDPAIAETLETNEVWLRFTTDTNGIGTGSVTTTAPLRGDSLSLVVHDPEGGTPPPKMACVDFNTPQPEPVTASGTFMPFAAAEAIDQTIAGSATLIRGMTGTTVSINVTGLDPVEVYSSHVHALPCGTTAAGGHYKIDPVVVIDPLNTALMEANELWPIIGNQPDGVADSSISKALHVARRDAQSIVIHRILPPVDGVTPPPAKVACAGLVPERSFNQETFGVAVPTADGETRGMGATFASATMRRELSGLTRVLLAIQGAPPDTAFKVHVHNLSCADGGGGHYKMDPAVTDALEENEMWLNMTTDSSGAAQDYMVVAHIARPEARSIVLHDASDGAKLFCADLQ
jgi:hypothetical protein